MAGLKRPQLLRQLFLQLNRRILRPVIFSDLKSEGFAQLRACVGYDRRAEDRVKPDQVDRDPEDAGGTVLVGLDRCPRRGAVDIDVAERPELFQIGGRAAELHRAKVLTVALE